MNFANIIGEKNTRRWIVMTFFRILDQASHYPSYDFAQSYTDAWLEVVPAFAQAGLLDLIDLVQHGAFQVIQPKQLFSTCSPTLAF